MRIQTSFLNRLYRPGLSRAILVLAVCAALIGSFYPTTPAYSQTAVTLLRLTAIGRINNILIEWETATEFNNAGFFVWASDSADGTFNPISDFIEAEGDGVTGAVYGFVDSDVQAAIPKYYKLEAIELNQESEFFGPVSAASNQGLPTTTLTATATSTISAPATQPAGAPTAAPTATARTSSNPTAATPASGNESAYPGQTTPTPYIQPAFN
ncbi:MAG TPA: hypothetical protein VN363_06295, partial [Anaerolineales bacterium]|nr:hypothetical protein [Anaerolineales bacterium]